MRRIAGILFILGALAWLAGCASTVNTAGPKIDAAKKAVDGAKAAGADKLCPDEFQSAEMKLKQAELLKGDGDDTQAAKAADQSAGLADVAKKCAEAHHAPAPVGIGEAGGAPDELKNFKASIYFDFNSNVIKPSERQKLDDALELLKKWAGDQKFYVLLTSYTDPPGTDEENMALAKRRCLVTRFYLSTNGFSTGRIYMQALDGHPENSAYAPPPAAVGSKNQPPAAPPPAPAKSTGKKDPEKRRVDITIVFTRPANVSVEGVPADF